MIICLDPAAFFLSSRERFDNDANQQEENEEDRMIIYFETLKSKDASAVCGASSKEVVGSTGTSKGTWKKWARPGATQRDLGMRLLQLLGEHSAEKDTTSFLQEHLQRVESKQLNQDDLFFRAQIREKLQSYRDQDNQESKRLVCSTEREELLTAPENYPKVVRQLFLSTDCKCYYCRRKVGLLYETTYDEHQWSLDRINNFFPHVLTNILLTCLQCNVRRGCQSVYSMKTKHTQWWSISLAPTAEEESSAPPLANGDTPSKLEE